MTDPTPLHEGGSGLGMSDADTSEMEIATLNRLALRENAALRRAATDQEAELIVIHRKYRLALMFAALTFIAGFLLAWGLK